MSGGQRSERGGKRQISIFLASLSLLASQPFDPGSQSSPTAKAATSNQTARWTEKTHAHTYNGRKREEERTCGEKRAENLWREEGHGPQVEDGGMVGLLPSTNVPRHHHRRVSEARMRPVWNAAIRRRISLRQRRETEGKQQHKRATRWKEEREKKSDRKASEGESETKTETETYTPIHLYTHTRIRAEKSRESEREDSESARLGSLRKGSHGGRASQRERQKDNRWR